MDVIEVPVTQNNKSKKKKNKKLNYQKEVPQENAEGSGVEKKEEKESASAFPPSFSVSEIKNKQRRHCMFMKLKQEKRKVNVRK